MVFPYTNPWIVIAAILIALLGAGRIARLVTYDDYPPTIWVRTQWSRITNDGAWAKLATCFWCFTPWVMLVCLGWLAASLWSLPALIVWFAFWGWLALSYVASMIVARDEPA